MKIPIRCAAAALAITALAGGAQAQLLGGVTGTAASTARGALDAMSVRSALGDAGATKGAALSTAGSAVGVAKGAAGDRLSDATGLARDQVVTSKMRAVEAGRDLGSTARDVQGQLAASQRVAGTAAAHGGGSTDLITGDLHAVFAEYAGFSARTPGVDTRDFTDRSTGVARQVAYRVRDKTGDVVVIGRERAGQALSTAGDARERVSDRARAAAHRTRSTAEQATGVARRDVHRVVDRAEDLKARPLPTAHVRADGSARVSVAAADANGKARADVNTRSRRAAASLRASGI